MNAQFRPAYELTGIHEGGFANDPNDHGKMTAFGISRKWWPTFEGWQRIDHIIARVGNNDNIITREIKLDIMLMDMIAAHYKRNFWDANNLGFLKYQSIANELFDTGVNCGTATAARMLQRALNLCNNAGKLYKDVGVDGKMFAPIKPSQGDTIRTLNERAQEIPVLNVLNMLQGARYIEIMENDSSQEVYLKGWLKRVVFDSRW